MAGRVGATLAIAAAWWLAVARAQEAGLPAEECASGQACAGDEELGVSLRQLRATARHDAEAEDPDDDFDPGLPGGWGEAADFADAAEAEEREALNASHKLHMESRWGSCARYRCVSYFVRRHACQCNSGCARYGSCCPDYYARCHHSSHHHHHAPAPPPPAHHGGRVMTLYHQTGPGVGPLILANGFRPGTQGWCGGGIYFATSAAATVTKAIGPDSHKGFLLEASVDVGRVKYMPRTCDRSLNGGKVLSEGYDSVSFDPGDGQEYIVYSNRRILSVRQIPM